MKPNISQGLKIALFLAFSIALICLLEYKIETDLRFHSGKDGGAFVQFESVIFLSILYQFLMGNNHFLIKLVIGTLIGIVAGVVGYLTCFYLFEWDFPFQCISLALIMTSPYLISKVMQLKKR